MFPTSLPVLSVAVFRAVLPTGVGGLQPRQVLHCLVHRVCTASSVMNASHPPEQPVDLSRRDGVPLHARLTPAALPPGSHTIHSMELAPPFLRSSISLAD